MAIDEADQPDAEQASAGETSASGSGDTTPNESDAGSGSGVRVGEYTWADFMEEYGYGDEVSTLYSATRESDETTDQLGLDTDEEPEPTVPAGADWNRVEFDPEPYLGYHPDDLTETVLPIAGSNGDELEAPFLEYVDPETTPVVKDVWTWEHYKWEYYYDEDGNRPRDENDDVVEHDEEEALGFDPETLEDRLSIGDDIAMELDDVVEERTVNVQEDIEEDEFFATAADNTTVSNRYDLEKTVPLEKKKHFREVERYWVNKPYAYVVIFHSEKENEKKYYMVEPYLNDIEGELQEFLSGKLRKAIKYSDDGVKEKADEDGRRVVIEDETRQLLKRYDLFEQTSGSKKAGLLETVQTLLDEEDEADDESGPSQLAGIEVRPEPILLAEDPDTLNEYQVEKLLYFLKRNFIGYERIDGIKHDINVEDISVDGYNSPVFVYHSEYEQIISNIYHGEDELDDFVVKLAQRSGKGISKRLPQVDATLPDGSRAQLTLGEEVSDHGTNYTIRQFKDVPFTPIDLINWNTFSLDEMAFLWLAIENHKSLIFAGGTASGKTTSLNAVSLFIPSSAKIVSIEDTREVELPQRNWIASVTRPSFADDEQGDVDEFDLLEAALRQRPDYIVMGEIRGEEGRTLFQVMSTGHTTYTTFHADSVDEVLKRFTTDPINVSKTMFTALDLVSIQTQTRVQGRKVRRNKSLTEINHYEAEHDEINVQDVYQWQAETDEFLKMGDSNTMEEIQFDRGWSTEKLEEELFKREVILAYLIKNGLNTYAEVAATVQAFINDPDTILTLIANGQLEESLDDLREMESVLIDVDQEKEELVPRPDATDETYNLSMDLLERAEESLFEEYRGKVPSGLASALGEVEEEQTVEVDGADDEFDFAGDIEEGIDDEWTFGDSSTDFTETTGTVTATADEGDEPEWFTDDGGFGIETTAAETEAEAAGASADAGTSGSADAAAPADTGGLSPAPAADSEPASAASDATPGSRSPSASGGTDSVPDESEPGTEFETASMSAAEPEWDADVESSFETESAETMDATENDVTVFPADDADEGDFGGLFDDMGETLDELEAVDDGDSTASEETSGEDGGGEVFSDDGSDSIFDPDPMAADSTERTARASDQEAPPSTDDSTTAAETADGTDSTGSEASLAVDGDEVNRVDDGDGDDGQPESAGEPTIPESAVPSIELGSGTPVDESGPGSTTGMTPSASEPDDDGTDGDSTPDEEGTVVEFSEDDTVAASDEDAVSEKTENSTEAETAEREETVVDPPAVSESREDGDRAAGADTDTDAAASDGTATDDSADATGTGGDTGTGTEADATGDATTESETAPDDTSIFGDESGSIFGDDPADGDGGDDATVDTDDDGDDGDGDGGGGDGSLFDGTNNDGNGTGNENGIFGGDSDEDTDE